MNLIKLKFSFNYKRKRSKIKTLKAAMKSYCAVFEEFYSHLVIPSRLITCVYSFERIVVVVILSRSNLVAVEGKRVKVAVTNILSKGNCQCYRSVSSFLRFFKVSKFNLKLALK